MNAHELPAEDCGLIMAALEAQADESEYRHGPNTRSMRLRHLAELIAEHGVLIPSKPAAQAAQ